MAQTVKIRLDGPGGLPMTEKVLKTTYPNSSRAPSTSPRCPSTPAIPSTRARASTNGGFRQKGNAGSSWSQLDMSEGTWHGGWNEHTQADWMEQFNTIAAARKEIQA